MGSGSLFFKVLFGVLAIVGFIWVLLSGTVGSGGTKTDTTTLNPDHHQPTENFKQQLEGVVGREKLVYSPELDLNFMMSKRRVPNGPDPIHNRRAGNSKRPPGQA